MAETRTNDLLGHLRGLLGRTGGEGVADAQLLERFVAQRDEAAFELLVWRHQRLVLGVCRRATGNVHDAEDAFSGQDYFPEEFDTRPQYYDPPERGFEREVRKRLAYWADLRAKRQGEKS